MEAGESDLEFLHSLYLDPRMMAHLGGPLSESVVQERLQKWMGHWRKFAFGVGLLRWKDTRQKIGVSGLLHSEIEGEKVLEMGWMIAPDFQKRGLAFEAAQGYFDFARHRLHPKTIIALPDEKNLASNRICEKLKFTRGKVFAYPFLDRTLDSVLWRFDF